MVIVRTYFPRNHQYEIENEELQLFYYRNSVRVVIYKINTFSSRTVKIFENIDAKINLKNILTDDQYIITIESRSNSSSRNMQSKKSYNESWKVNLGTKGLHSKTCDIKFYGRSLDTVKKK